MNLQEYYDLNYHRRPISLPNAEEITPIDRWIGEHPIKSRIVFLLIGLIGPLISPLLIVYAVAWLTSYHADRDERVRAHEYDDEPLDAPRTPEKKG